MDSVDGEENRRYTSGTSLIYSTVYCIHIFLQSTLKAKQADIEATLVKIITAPSPFPAPGRAIRNVVARCLVSLYTRSETRTLFDTIQAFLKIVGDSKTADKDTRRMYVLQARFL